MSFIEKEEPVVLNIKLTSLGRKKISEGNFKVDKIGIGDSEIDYKFIKDNNIDPNTISILKPMDKNPDIISFIKEDVNKPNLLSSTLTSKIFNVDNLAVERGFFTEFTQDDVKINTSPEYIKQADCLIKLKDVVGNKNLRIRKSPSYATNFREPIVGDILMVRWSNPNIVLNENIKFDEPHPILFYKIVSIISGTLMSDTLLVEVDRNLPNFSTYSGENTALLVVYPSELTVSSYQSIDFINESVFSFFENYNLPLKSVPIWNMSIIFKDDVAGVNSTLKQFKDSKSAKYTGFLNYIQNHKNNNYISAIIHYTNQSPSNDYGEGFYENSAKLKLPTIMWHKSNKMGLTLSGIGDSKNLDGLNIFYRDLADENGYVVGKVFNSLKLFLIEDAELIFALSYKSNRNWTLPEFKLDINSNITYGCPICTLDYNTLVTQPASFGETGKILISDFITSQQPADVIAILSKNNITLSTKMLTVDNAGLTILFDDLSGGDYNVKIFDLSSPNCFKENNFTISDLQSTIEITGGVMEQF